jgi:hypothetical protein
MYRRPKNIASGRHSSEVKIDDLIDLPPDGEEAMIDMKPKYVEFEGES